MQNPTFSVIIVNYNGGHYLHDAVQSLTQQTFRDFELIVLDNASTDGSADTLDLSEFPSARLVKMDDNLGFAAANNLGARLAKGRWLALLNPDAVAAPDWLHQVVLANRRHPECRVFASAQYNAQDPDKIDGAGDAYLIMGVPWRGGYGHHRTAMPGEGECFSPCGAAAIMDRELFLTHNGFDERFFCYCEDVDLGFRFQLAGEECWFLPNAKVYHAGSAISGVGSPFSTYHGTRNRLWTYVKNMPLALQLLTLPAHIVLNMYLIARSVLQGRLGPTLRGNWDGLRGLPDILSGSDWRVRERNVTLSQLARTMMWNPFRMSRREPHVRMPVPDIRTLSVRDQEGS